LRVFKTKEFSRYARREGINDAKLSATVRRMEHGLIDADLGGGLIKQRFARVGEGKRGGFRIRIALQPLRRTVFVYGFAKSERDNIQPDELDFWRKVALAFLKMDEAKLETMLRDGEIKEVNYAEENEP
jgi:hypothetical protein